MPGTFVVNQGCDLVEDIENGSFHQATQRLQNLSSRDQVAIVTQALSFVRQNADTFDKLVRFLERYADGEE